MSNAATLNRLQIFFFVCVCLFSSVLLTFKPKMTEKQFERIYNDLWSKLYGIAYSYFRDRITAQEVTQDVFVNLWLKRDSLSPIQNVEAYLLRSVKNRIYNQFEKIHA